MSDVSFSIRVIDSSSRPVSNIKVTVFDDANIGGSYDTEYTDSDGWTNFSFYCLSSSLQAKVYIDGDEEGNYTFF